MGTCRHPQRVYPCIDDIQSIFQYFWANYSDLSQGHPKRWLSKGHLPQDALNAGLGIIGIYPDIGTLYLPPQQQSPPGFPTIFGRESQPKPSFVTVTGWGVDFSLVPKITCPHPAANGQAYGHARDMKSVGTPKKVLLWLIFLATY